jgi:steroid delta-isomerase
MSTSGESPSAIFSSYLARHASNDLDGVVGLFSNDAVLEDPVGSPPRRGQKAIRAFYAETHHQNGPLEIELVGAPLIGGDELAAHVRARLTSRGDHPAVDVIYLLHFDREGRIDSLRAFF